MEMGEGSWILCCEMEGCAVLLESQFKSQHIENLKRFTSWDPVDWESDSASDRIWRNLMNRRDLWSREDRRYAREMLKQVTEHEEEEEEIQHEDEDLMF